MRFTVGERRHLQSLVQDCNVYRLSERESLDYIRRRFGKSISASYFYKIKERLESDDEAQRWLNDFAKTGFVTAHLERLSEMRVVRDLLFSMLNAETQKENPDRLLILSITGEIARVNRRLEQLQNGAPILAQMKAVVESSQEAEVEEAIRRVRQWEEEEENEPANNKERKKKRLS